MSTNFNDPSAQQQVNLILRDYLTQSQIDALLQRWLPYPELSVRVMQNCIADIVSEFPKLRAHRSAIRQGFWHIINGTAPNLQNDALQVKKKNASPTVNAFYECIEHLANTFDAPNQSVFFQKLHQEILSDRKLKKYGINIQAFLNQKHPDVPDDSRVLNRIIQQAYVVLCEMIGPVEADKRLYQVVANLKQTYDADVVEALV